MESAAIPTAIDRPERRPSRARRRAIQALSLALVLFAAGVWFVLLRPSSLGGPATYVIVAGASMEPGLRSGDLVVAFERDSYAMGDVVVYRVPSAEPGAGTHIVHRIVGGSPHTGFLVKGDAREGADYSRPRTDEIVGKMQLSLPHAGSALVFLRGPLGLAFVAALTTFLIALGAFAGPSRKPDETS